MTGEPLAPGQSPVPVIIIQQGHEGMAAWSGEWWVTVSAFALTLVTLLTIVHTDIILHHLVKLVRAITPPYRRTPAPSPVTDDGATLPRAPLPDEPYV